MSQNTDTTQVMPLADSPQAQVDPDATVTMPIVAPTAPAVPVVPPAPAFDVQRARLLHIHRVLGRILSTPQLPVPDRAEMWLYGDGLNLLVRDTLDDTALNAYAVVFGGTPTSTERDSSYEPGQRQRYAELLTVIDGVQVRVWSLAELAAVAQSAPEPAVVDLDETPAAESEPVAAAEPEPQHDPAPAPQPETPAEHPEAA